MIKNILITLLMMPTVLLAGTEFQCSTESAEVNTHLNIQLNFQELKTSGKLFTRAQVQQYGAQPEQVSCVVFEITKKYNAAGFSQTYVGRFSGGRLVSITEEASANEGPAEFVKGYISYHYATEGETAVPLNCVKKTSN